MRAATANGVELARRNHRRAVGFFWVWLMLATGLSLAGNAVHAWLTAEPDTRWLASAVAAVPPAALLLSVHGLAVLAKSTASGVVYRTAVLATAALAAGAFTLSFVALRDLAVIAGIPSTLAPVLPLVIDLAIGVCTLALVAIGDKPAPRRRNATSGAAAGATSRVNSATSSRDARSSEHASANLAPRDDAPPSGVRSAALGVDDLTREVAADLVAQKVTRQSVDTVAAILAAHRQGDPPNRIAKQVGVHHSAVSRVIDAATAQRQRSLASVG